MKLSWILFLTAAISGGLLTSIAGDASVDDIFTQSQTALGASGAPRGNRLAQNEQNPDAGTIAEQIRATQRPPRSSQQGTDSFPAPIVSQVQPPPTGEDGTGQSAPEQPIEPEVDESALRYFAARGDRARLEAEIARLRTLYPNWTPPPDPLAVPENRDRQLEDMWQLYSEGHYAEVRKAIAERLARESGWQPPPDLLERLQVAESRVRLVNASNLKQYSTVIEIGAATSSLLNCGDVDVLWRIAEAFIRTDRRQRGVDAYTYILKNCTNSQERSATIEKAAELLPYGSVQALLALEQTGQSGSREFDGIRNELARRFVGEAGEKPELTIDSQYLERIRGLAAREQRASDSLLLGWYYLRRNNMAEAERWFRASREKENSAAASQGLAVALIARNAAAEAEEVMYGWRSDSEEATATYLAATANLLSGDPLPSIPEPVLQRMAVAVLQEKYVPTAQQLGWYARALDQPQTAIRWFETALQWKPDDEPSAYGLAITKQQINDRAGVQALQRAWAGRSERIANLALLTARTPSSAPTRPPVSSGTSIQARPSASPDGPSPKAVVAGREAGPAETRRSIGCSTTAQITGLSSDQALARGWCLMDLNRPIEAAAAFEVALQSRTQRVREDAAYGQSLAYLRLGLTSKAAVAATKAPQSSQRAVELQVAILADYAISAFDAGRYREALIYLDQRSELRPESADLTILRGYSYMNLDRPRDALRIFEAVAATGNRDASRGMADVRAMLQLGGGT
ncbi:tetratricopeptide repeat protein [Neorhizobium petrolearium]|uniref:tetratricopeptide repeat protein n=1 Tax=Neorhizobium TaxID=1525371 RepID=UPI00389A6226